MRTQELNANVYQYILDSINGDSYEREFATPKQKVDFAYECFLDQAWFDNNKKIFKNNQVNCLADFIQGMPSWLDVETTHYGIIEIGKKWGSLPENAKAWQEDKIIGNWFNFIAYKFFQLKDKLDRNSKTVQSLTV